MNFTDLQLIEPIAKAIQEQGYTNPTPIQERSIPEILNGRDFLGCAQTGTGKTAAFSIPILQNLSKKKISNNHIKALILTPTRELAIQIEENINAYGKYLPLKQLVIFGGVKQGNQEAALRRGIDILVATPGRLLDFIAQGIISLKNIEIFVLDEADRMLDMGFVHDVKRVIKLLPQKRQTLFFSATMPGEIQKLANSILNNPVKVEVTPVSSTADTIKQSVYFVEKDNKLNLLSHILQNDISDSVLVFARTKHGADKIARKLQKDNISAEAIHGNKSQNARQNALNNFKSGKTRVLVATDIAARGIDIDELKFVINFELSDVSETYVHRIGRTGRAGAEGNSISFVDGLDLLNLKNTEKLIGKKIPIVKDHPFHTDDLVAQKRDSNNKPMSGGGERQGPRPARTPNNKKPAASTGFKKPKNKNFTRKK
ncbi:MULTISPECIES: DEAD/DEAH box helicase [Chryseobacterium]|uniref:DEAD-box ATP-dependent RNA helicase RhpA n=1 Tax=Chryseobacterium rhizosphaerae TaxID=395937 RepID=A0AAE3YAC9_9FLAO|nr:MULTISPECIES: DEAD/DEAH box helicase [Chryseobacterium]MBL3550134.1 DEAD/DEAH box helicase [Chryseobacterium sp. KMC2]MDC8099214.1 DEAD/DEAH box helicase [Chryseobacterium rhizosphaerae]MDR6527934.1 ATP-dependent RNA helicase RhlE [Chryseobacterium rhizosphaerae]MDR6546370.1 ATP-dependent RNA helicase RhlE [Chryseobacterium rhizosphaerae]REC75552.1 ATP-dependent helicase [Chryseobacterium rhizosphaerae]